MILLDMRYYSNIVGKYGAPVQKALQKLQNLKITTVCSTHGPVWTEEIPRVVRIYDRLSRYEAEEGVVIAYGSMYGNTEEVAEAIAEESRARARPPAAMRVSMMVIVTKLL